MEPEYSYLRRFSRSRRPDIQSQACVRLFLLGLGASVSMIAFMVRAPELFPPKNAVKIEQSAGVTLSSEVGLMESWQWRNPLKKK
jgi:hypothetical protein